MDGGAVEQKRGEGEGKGRGEEEVPSVSLRAPAGGSSSCLPSQRRFLLHFKWWYSSITVWQLHQASCKHAKASSVKPADATHRCIQEESVSHSASAQDLSALTTHQLAFLSGKLRVNIIHFNKYTSQGFERWHVALLPFSVPCANFLIIYSAIDLYLITQFIIIIVLLYIQIIRTCSHKMKRNLFYLWRALTGTKSLSAERRSRCIWPLTDWTRHESRQGLTGWLFALSESCSGKL